MINRQLKKINLPPTLDIYFFPTKIEENNFTIHCNLYLMLS